MVQFNLLPDVKLEFVKSRRTKYLMTFISFVAGAVALSVLLFSFFFVNVVQRKSLGDLQKDINAYSKQLKDKKDLDKILTVQNQLGTLPTLHEQKPVVSRLFDYISQVTPQQASLNKLNIDFDAKTISVGGTAPSFDVVSNYTDTLKATKFIVDKEKDKTKAFSNVVLTSFARTDKDATFTIDFAYEPALFEVDKKIGLVLPTTTRTSQDNLFGAGQ
jgi:Tfp pilus assembly protein PilN